MDQFSGGDRGNRPYVPGGCRTGSGHLSSQVERINDCWFGRLRRSISGLHGRRSLRSPLDDQVELAGRCRAFYNVRCRRICRHVGAGIQCHRFRKSHPRSLFCERSRNCHRPWPYFFAVHDQDCDLHRCERGDIRCSAFPHPAVLQEIRRKVSELEAKYLLFILFAMGGLAVWSGSEAVLPAYVIGMVLAGTVGEAHILIRRLRTLTFGLLTPFYFIRAGAFVSVPALAAAPLVFTALFFGKMGSKVIGLFPTVKAFKYQREEGLYFTLMMSTGLTFGTISALFGINHGIIDQAQYSHLVATVIGSAVIPTMIANAWFMPRHLLRKSVEEKPVAQPVTLSAERGNS